MKSKVQNPRDKCINSLETNENVKQVLIRLIFINGNEKRVATPATKFMLSHQGYSSTKGKMWLKIGHYLKNLEIIIMKYSSILNKKSMDFTPIY